jgi:hypothetical protein
VRQGRFLRLVLKSALAAQSGPSTATLSSRLISRVQSIILSAASFLALSNVRQTAVLSGMQRGSAVLAEQKDVSPSVPTEDFPLSADVCATGFPA